MSFATAIWLTFLFGLLGIVLIEFLEDAPFVGIVSLLFAAMILSGALFKHNYMNTYYMPAEIVAVNEESTYFGNEEGHIYYCSRNPNWKSDVPYLLHMDSCGTEDVTDDIIMAVWHKE